MRLGALRKAESETHGRSDLTGVVPGTDGDCANLLVAANTTGAVVSKLISPQNLAIAATTVVMDGQESVIFLRVVGWSARSPRPFLAGCFLSKNSIDGPASAPRARAWHDGKDFQSSKEGTVAATRRTYEIVLSNIEADLRSGAIKPGDQLPGERSLAEKYGISRASVREAVRILDAMGVVRTSSGSGPNSGAIVVSNPSAGLSTAFRYHVATQHLPVQDIVQTRILLETWAGRAAASKEHDGDAVLDGVRGMLDAMDDPGLDQEVFHLLDAQFHVAVASLAGNAVIETIMASLSQSIRGYVTEAVDKVGDWDDIAVTLRQQHRGIVDAIGDHDPDAAEQRLREHIEWFYHRTLTPEPGAAATPTR